jgi:hypothetical protein
MTTELSTCKAVDINTLFSPGRLAAKLRLKPAAAPRRFFSFSLVTPQGVDVLSADGQGESM